MKRFYRMVGLDIRQGIISAYLKYMVVLIISFAFTQNYYVKIENYIANGKVVGEVTFFDILIWFFKGMKEYIPTSNKPFEIPVDFLLLNIILAIIIGNYPMKDINGYGRSILVRSDTRLSWWLSKCIWNVLSVITFYTVIYVGIIGTYVAHGGLENGIKLLFNADLMKAVFQVDLDNVNSYVLMITTIVLPIITSIAISMLQMTIAFYLNSIVSYVIIIAMYIFSAFYMKWFMMGNYIMMYRNESINQKGMNLSISLIVDAGVVLISIVSGYLYFRRYDVLEKNNDI